MFKKKEIDKSCNQSILEALLTSQEVLSVDAQNHIKSFVITQKSENGGYIDRAGKADLYYTVFGYTLALIFDLKLNISKEQNYLERIKQAGNLDFVHAICLVRCFFLLEVIALKQISGIKAYSFLKINFGKDILINKLIKTVKSNCKNIFNEVEEYASKDGGYNHNTKCSQKSTIYANYLVWTMLQDLKAEQLILDKILNANKALRLHNGSFANQEMSMDGVTSSTAAGLIMDFNSTKSKDWLKQMLSKRGGFMAAREVPIADLLSTSTALLALKLSGENMQDYAENSVNFINLHWDESGGFFGSIADMTCDVEYTYYALLGLGVLS